MALGDTRMNWVMLEDLEEYAVGDEFPMWAEGSVRKYRVLSFGQTDGRRRQMFLVDIGGAGGDEDSGSSGGCGCS